MFIDLHPGMTAADEFRYLLHTSDIRGTPPSHLWSRQRPDIPIGTSRKSLRPSQRGTVIVNVTQCVNGGSSTTVATSQATNWLTQASHLRPQT